ATQAGTVTAAAAVPIADDIQPPAQERQHRRGDQFIHGRKCSVSVTKREGTDRAKNSRAPSRGTAVRRSTAAVRTAGRTPPPAAPVERRPSRRSGLRGRSARAPAAGSRDAGSR